MRIPYKTGLAMLLSAGLGAVAIEALHAQAKPKAYYVAEVEVTGQLAADLMSRTRSAIEAHHGHSLRTLNGRVIPIDGSTPPKNVALVEWDSVEDALSFYKSAAWTDGDAAREKAQKTLRRYIVEAEK
jgi:uncharacterized protein (DUF1330 family)